jgi:hypothetical protein
LPVPVAAEALLAEAPLATGTRGGFAWEACWLGAPVFTLCAILPLVLFCVFVSIVLSFDVVAAACAFASAASVAAWGNTLCGARNIKSARNDR